MFQNHGPEVFDNQCSGYWLPIMILKFKDHPCPLSPDLGLWRMLKVPDWGLASDLDLDMITGLWYTNDPNFGSLSWFWRCKEHPCPLSPHLGLWRMLEFPEWGLASWSWFGYDYSSLIHPCSKFWFSNLILRCKENPCPLSPHLRFWRTLEVPDWGLAS